MKKWWIVPVGVLALAGGFWLGESHLPAQETPAPTEAVATVPAPAPAPVAQVPESEAQVKLSFAPIVKTAAPSVVNIYAKRVVSSSPFQGDPFYSQMFNDLRARPRVQNSLGSGVIVGKGNIVVSNYHVVGNATDIRVALPDRREYDAEIILADADTDLAVMRLVGAPELPALEFSDSDAVEVGDLVLAVGNPFGVGQTVSSGIVSALARTSTIEGRAGYFIQTDAPINPGNSGGALVDMSGRLVGINSAILSRSGGSNGIGFAIPANLVRQLVNQALNGQTEVQRPWSGLSVQAVDAGLADALGLEMPHGVLVSAMNAESPFAVAGVKVGDVITTIAGQPVDGGAEMQFRLLTLGVGAQETVGFRRDGQAMEATFTLIPPPETPERAPYTVDTRSVLNGLSVANVNPAVVDELNLPDETDGVVVTGVDGIAQRTQLRPGDILRRINGTEITSTGDVERVAAMKVRGFEIELERAGQRALLRLRNM